MKKYIKYSSFIFIITILTQGRFTSAEMSVPEMSNKASAETSVIKTNTDQRNEVDDNSMSNKIEDSRKKFRNNLNKKNIEIKEKLDTQRETFKKDLLKIKDERKRTTVESINTKIQNLNIKATDGFSVSISRIENVLGNIEVNMSSLNLNDTDKSTIEKNNALALKAIDDAKSAIISQMSKPYTINVSNEKNLKQETQKVRDTLNKDLKGINDKIKNAHNIVKKSGDILANISNITPNTKVENEVKLNNN